ncbi:MAG: alpha-1,4-glucan--maltose-1-phosphate maltosyltransferase [Endomicrobiales bacterium]|nr:alpha-1,4-glucan--maltose-1-phosphate maltosyltransferase [Endomicrobiales bacterium]
MKNGRKRVVIENLRPEVDKGKYYAKCTVGERFTVQADIFADSHDEISAFLIVKEPGLNDWKRIPMKLVENDLWEASLIFDKTGLYKYTISAYMDHIKTLQTHIKKKLNANQDISLEIKMITEYVSSGANKQKSGGIKKLDASIKKLENEKSKQKLITYLLDPIIYETLDKHCSAEFTTTYENKLTVLVERKESRFSSWYELFPRSFSKTPGKHGTFKDCERMLPEIATMGFNVLYFPPIHPIGNTNRKGKNNAIVANPDDPGSPWSIGSELGGHKAIHPELGTMKDFQSLLKKAKDYSIEISLDIAFQCSQDHPYIKEHPEWFLWRPDNTIKYAENPPKKYEDIVPFNFETAKWQELWKELESIFVFWIEKGVRIFRVDNPHTKPYVFWEWLIAEINKKYEGIIFLAEAFTRNKKMYKLAKIGFTQSYTYFTWRYTKKEFITYMNELTKTGLKDIFRPNFWTNTPDILSVDLQHAKKPSFANRLILAATLSSNYGMYGPAFELMDNEPFPGKEEYNNNEKYEIKIWDRNKPGNLRELITKVNKIRNENEALQSTCNIRFYEIHNDQLMVYEKFSDDKSNIIIVAVNFDTVYKQSGWVRIPINDFKIKSDEEYVMYDLLNNLSFTWKNEWNYIELNPTGVAAHIFRLERK